MRIITTAFATALTVAALYFIWAVMGGEILNGVEQSATGEKIFFTIIIVGIFVSYEFIWNWLTSPRRSPSW